jgi:hypothetical protein
MGWQSTHVLRTSPALACRRRRHLLLSVAPRDDVRPMIPAGIHDELRLKYRLRRRWQFTRDPPPQLVEKRPVECYTRIPRTRRPVAMEDDQASDESSYSFSPW